MDCLRQQGGNSLCQAPGNSGLTVYMQLSRYSTLTVELSPEVGQDAIGPDIRGITLPFLSCHKLPMAALVASPFPELFRSRHHWGPSAQLATQQATRAELTGITTTTSVSQAASAGGTDTCQMFRSTL